jgi:hypothetical protein
LQLKKKRRGKDDPEKLFSSDLIIQALEKGDFTQLDPYDYLIYDASKNGGSKSQKPAAEVAEEAEDVPEDEEPVQPTSSQPKKRKNAPNVRIIRHIVSFIGWFGSSILNCGKISIFCTASGETVSICKDNWNCIDKEGSRATRRRRRSRRGGTRRW